MDFLTLTRDRKGTSPLRVGVVVAGICLCLLVGMVTEAEASAWSDMCDSLDYGETSPWFCDWEVNCRHWSIGVCWYDAVREFKIQKSVSGWGCSTVDSRCPWTGCILFVGCGWIW